MQKRDWQEYSSKALLASVLISFAYLFLKYAAFLVLPFAAAMLLASPIIALSELSARVIGGRYRGWAVFWWICAWALTALLIPPGIKKLASEAEALFCFVCADGRLESLGEEIARLLSGIPALAFLNGANGSISGFVSTLLQKLGSALESFVIGALGKAAMALPGIALAVFVCVVASFYFCVDARLLKKELSLCDQSLKKIFARLAFALRAYAKTYFLLFLLTFFELYAGLSLLGREYALGIAFITALLDLLPLIGTGIVLVPWAIFLFVEGQVWVGVGMLALFLLINLLRRIAETKLISKNFGIHPLLSLAAMYIGMSLFGFFGMIALPVALVLCKDVLKRETGSGA